jgi:peptidoglycan/xylan/chitin deacetylase (PgdA/CDA1 family)
VHVVRSYPIDGDSDSLPAAPLRIVFDQPMDPDPAALQVAITPTLPLQAEWTAADALALHTGERQPGIEYRLTLAKARGQSGGGLEKPFTLTFGRGGRGAPLAILMYHHVRTLAPDAPAAVKEWTVSPEAFVAQLDLVASLGGHVVPLSQMVDYLERGEPLPPRPVAVTFDDGNKDTLTTAVPVLQARHLPATFFVPAQYAESGNPAFMTWDDVKALAAAGFSLGGHSYQHSYVNNLTPEQAEHQIGDEKRKIEALTGTKVECFAYPFGLFTDKTVAQLQQYGYRAAVTIVQRVYQKPGDLFRLGRIRLGYDDPLERLRQKLP